ncbi:hypothetical protein A9970_11720 [Sphingobacterium sp. UME9]|nr:hypothetical protein [Sphingobacterium sp. UME9]
MTPYTYTGNSPINFLDQNGDSIIIWGVDDNRNMYSVMDENGIAYHYTRDACGNINEDELWKQSNKFWSK